ncbi:MAG: hypothetical protein K2P12_05295 [Clostridia bacterium]|nr:hypothetical protein [Clostridia bacterium]
MAGKKSKRDIMLETLYKKGIGYQTEEIVEEYASEEKGGELLKRKVTIKNVPPDVTALKTYLDISKQTNEFDNLSDSELHSEKLRLLKLLKNMEDKNEIN